MTFIWFLYYTVRLVQNKDDSGDGMLIIPALLLDAIIVSIYPLFT